MLCDFNLIACDFFHDQCVCRKCVYLCGRHMVFKIFSAQIDWRFEINAVVAEVDETYEFVMGKAGKQAVF